MNASAHPVSCDGKTYGSLKEFANDRGLNYSRVLHYFRKGRTPEEIVELCQFTQASKAAIEPVEHAKRHPVMYKNVKYDSIYAAAEALGVSPARIYDIRKRKGLSAEEAIDYALSNLSRPGDGESPNSKPCVVEGVTYPSREAAIQAYHMTRITVYSRMEREGISFEEALIQGRNSATYRPPTISLFPTLRLIPAKSDISQPVLAELTRSLEYYKQTVQPMTDLLTGLPALFVNGHSYIYFNHDARGLELLSELPINVDRDTLEVLNSSYVATKLFRNNISQKIFLFSFIPSKEEGQEIKTLLNSWFSYVCIRDKLMRLFSDKDFELSENKKTG